MTDTDSPARAAAALHMPAGGRVLVLGDVILDSYLRGEVTRISAEAPVPIVEVDSEEYRLGGAANVAVVRAKNSSTPTNFCTRASDPSLPILGEAQWAVM